jgi:plastocyanin
MGKRALLLVATIFLFAVGLSAQTVSKTFNISVKDFSTIEGTPRIVRNGFDHEWLVAWRQQGSPSKILARIIESDGVLRSKKTLATKVGNAPQSFDIFFDGINYNYLLVFENSSGLQVQLFSNVLKKIGTPKQIEAGVSGTIPRLSFDSVAKKFLVFWIGDNGTSLKSILVDSTGNVNGTVRTLAHATGSDNFKSLNISTNQDTGNLVALVTESNGASAKLLGFRIKPDGTLQKTKPLSLSPSDPDLNLIFADSSFSDSGTGFAFWSDDHAIKRRKLSRSGGLASAVKSIDGQADDNTVQTSILFDSKNNLFIPAWTLGNHVRAMALDSAGNVKNNPFEVATSAFTNSRNPTTSYDGQLGNAIVVWEDSDENAKSSSGSAKFRVRGAIFFFQSNTSSKNITIGDNFFSSSSGNGNLTIAAGDTVTWTHSGNNTHTVTSGAEANAGTLFNSGNLTRGQTFSFRFTTAGSFPYFCMIHGSNTMSGTITVTTGGGEPPPRY